MNSYANTDYLLVISLHSYILYCEQPSPTKVSQRRMIMMKKQMNIKTMMSEGEKKEDDDI